MNHPDPVTQTRTIGGPRTLLEMCLDLRMAHNGSADPISEEDTAAALAYLSYRLATWKPSILPSGARFDSCVRALVLATIIEVQCRQAERARILGLPEIQSPITDVAIDAAVAGAENRWTHPFVVGLASDALCAFCGKTAAEHLATPEMLDESQVRVALQAVGYDDRGIEHAVSDPVGALADVDRKTASRAARRDILRAYARGQAHGGPK